MHVCACMYICVWVSVLMYGLYTSCMSGYVCMIVCMYLWVHATLYVLRMYACINVWVSECMHAVSIYSCMHECLSVDMYVWLNVHLVLVYYKTFCAECTNVLTRCVLPFLQEKILLAKLSAYQSKTRSIKPSFSVSDLRRARFFTWKMNLVSTRITYWFINIYVRAWWQSLKIINS